MSYHDSPYYYDYNSTGIAVVNPLIRVENKLIKIKKLISELDSETEMTINDLKSMIEEIIEEK
jgi:hypothetical protein|tara:strand:- start:276 stop:464 length:189 start_codon:yes stop_codon:yes gene_type:complete